MRYWIIFSGVVGFLLMGCQTAHPDPLAATTTAGGNLDGQALYQTHCGSCHGANGEGQFPQDPYFPDATGRVGAPPHDSTGHTWHHPMRCWCKLSRRGVRCQMSTLCLLLKIS